MSRNVFLADLNNERSQKNDTYKTNLLKLNKLALIKCVARGSTALPRRVSALV